MQGVTFAAVGPMITIGTNHGITAIYGSVIACGLFMMLLAPVFGRLIRFFPPLVTGTIILIIGISLMRVAAGWSGGGTAEGADFGSPGAIGMGFFTLLVIILIERFAPESLRRVSILLGLVIGTVIGGIFNTFPYTAFAQNVGLVAITGVRTRHVATGAGIHPGAAGSAAQDGGGRRGHSAGRARRRRRRAVGMVAAGGVRTLTKVKFNNPNILVVAISVGVAMLTEVKLYYTDRSLADAPVSVALDLYTQFPDWFQTIFHSGISAGALTAIVLNLLLNSGTRGTDDELAESGLAASDAPRGALPDPLDALRAADPSTPPERLRALAEERPELQTIIVTNPSTDRETCAWIREQGDPQVAAICEKWDDVTEGRFSKRSR